MRNRPKTLAGLLLTLGGTLIRRYPRPAWAIALVGLAGGWSMYGGPAAPACHLSVARWEAGVERHDYLEAVRFSERGSGLLQQGDNQVIRIESRFRYRPFGEARVKIRVPGHPAYVVGYEILEGHFRFEQSTPSGPRPIAFRCRIRFDRSPFPTGQPSTRDYYAVSVDP